MTSRKRQCDGCGDEFAGNGVCSPCLAVFSAEHEAALAGSEDALATHYRLVNLYTVCCARAKTQASYRRIAEGIATALAADAPKIARKLPKLPASRGASSTQRRLR
jgi:hypothetical protein